MKKIFLLVPLFFVFVSASFAQKPPKDIDKSESSIVNSPVKILYKPPAAYPKDQDGTICVTGTVILKVIFLDSGKIGKIVVVNGLPYGISENAVEAAKKIKFKPALKNGKTVSVSKTMTYNFTIY